MVSNPRYGGGGGGGCTPSATKTTHPACRTQSRGRGEKAGGGATRQGVIDLVLKYSTLFPSIGELGDVALGSALSKELRSGPAEEASFKIVTDLTRTLDKDEVRTKWILLVEISEYVLSSVKSRYYRLKIALPGQHIYTSVPFSWKKAAINWKKLRLFI